MSFLKSLFSRKMQQATVIENFIETLALRQGDHCEFVKFISFENVEVFMKDKGARVLSVGDPYPNESVVYGLSLGGKKYDVRASRSIDRAGALITSTFSEN